MSSTIEDVKKLGDRAWYFHFASKETLFVVKKNV
jgi:hypothetical protein